MSDLNYDELDPGIRELVHKLRTAGFETTDSGDGVSKPKEWYEPDEHGITEAFDFPHVVIRVTPYFMIEYAHRVLILLPRDWDVEATLYLKDQRALLFCHPYELPDPRK